MDGRTIRFSSGERDCCTLLIEDWFGPEPVRTLSKRESLFPASAGNRKQISQSPLRRVGTTTSESASVLSQGATEYENLLETYSVRTRNNFILFVLLLEYRRI